ncbi:alpha/beta fold hydrolase [Bacteriovorax sp. DB6_IX]|uniref:alpha/beta fold hydrolase n=1 Tax=Bacteriovorax sp. DB6_IX TaxID=1353530 RepID=UPI00038A0AC3|nr:alpha/beta hydrolase [Bacteriovorax sp. DB6_IX]EQC51686.1 Ndr family protein [Bacteriovorax sp. DB6_IX]
MFWKNKALYHDVDEKTKIHYKINFDPKELTDNDTVIVFNYGLVCNVEHFMLQTDFFHEQGHKVLIHDYRCHFESTSKDGVKSVTFKNIANDMHSLIEELGIKKTIMFGHSMGVNVTLEYARMYPNQLRGMVLISGTVFPPQDVMFDSNIMDISEPVLHQVKDSLSDLYQYIWKNSYKNPIARFFVWQGGFNTKKTETSFVEYYMKKIGELPPDIFFHLLTEMKRHTVINDLENIKTSALIIGGDKDKIIPNYLQRILKKYLENSTLYIVKDGSHVPQVDFPESINERSLSFIRKLV